MKRILFFAVVTALILPPVTSVSGAEDVASIEPIRERIEWCDIWFTDANKEDRPRVLMIGDSITRGYFSLVERNLGDQAYCSRLTTSRSVCDPIFLMELKLVLSQYRFAAIHFNNGLHGWGYTEGQYKASLGLFLDLLKGEAQGATLIWASTTPVLEDSGMGGHAKRVAKRNAIATELTRERGIATNDLHGLAIGHREYYSKDGVHFSEKGKRLQGEQVAAAFEKALAISGDQ
jgi:hypothetical protein